jgi:hypothetical protein
VPALAALILLRSHGNKNTLLAKSAVLLTGMSLIWTYLFGPFLSLMPARWKRMLPRDAPIQWERATAVSGFVQACAAPVALAVWYSYSVGGWVSRILDAALSRNSTEEISVHAVGFAGLLIWAMHPLTWLICYLGIEGVVRLLGAALADNVLGTFPLAVVDRIYLRTSGKQEKISAAEREFSQTNLSSYFGTIGEGVRRLWTPEQADELQVRNDAECELLTIQASQRKPDWDPPRVVRIGENYYSLISATRLKGPQPYRYLLRKLQVGVPSRRVLVYEPAMVTKTPGKN